MDDLKLETKENHGEWAVIRYIFCVICYIFCVMYEK
jgi:hypothetical protein